MNGKYIVFIIGVICLCAAIVWLVFAINMLIEENKSLKTGTCNMYSCTGSARYCGSTCRGGCVNIICIDMVTNLYLNDSSYQNSYNFTNRLYTNDVIKNTTNLSCDPYIGNWTLPMQCYYDKRNLPKSISLIKPFTSDGVIIMMIFSCIALFITIIAVPMCACWSFANGPC